MTITPEKAENKDIIDKELNTYGANLTRKQWQFAATITYFMTFSLFGCYNSILGPSVIHLSELTGHAKTDFGVMFTVKGLGFILGSYITGKLEAKYDHHKIYIYGCILLTLVGAIFPNVTSFYILVLLSSLIGAGAGIFNVLANQLVVMIKKGENVSGWMQFLHFGFGVGSFIGPLILALVGFKYTFYLISICVTLWIYPLYVLKTPSHNEHLNASQKENSDDQNGVDLDHKHLDFIPTPHSIAKYMGFFFMIYVGCELGTGNWISTYSVQANILSEENAAYPASIYWLGLAIGRFAGIFMTQIISTKKYLQLEIQGAILSGIFMIVMPKVVSVLYIFAFSFGFFFSSMFPLCMALPNFLKMDMTGQQVAMLTIFSSLGELIIPYSQGLLMKFSFKFFPISIFACVLIFYSIEKLISIQSKNILHQRNQDHNDNKKDIPLIDIEDLKK